MQVEYEHMYSMLCAAGMPDWSAELADRLAGYFADIRHGDYPAWCEAITALPNLAPSVRIFDEAVVRIGADSDCDDATRACIHKCLRELMPWRKGPFNFFGVGVDAEWRSDLKWSRLIRAIAPLGGRNVLDIGCGNGYYGWRMLGAGARLVIGTDPTLRFIAQFQAAKKYLDDCPHYVLPFALEDLYRRPPVFDSVFSMGVIYHRRDPAQHVSSLFQCLRSEGQVVLESLVVDKPGDSVLVPDGRYARMNNVRVVPTCRALQRWLDEAGFVDARVIDVCKTTQQEQRRTDWMIFESLPDFLDPADASKTVEGYPAPIRAILLAEKP